MCRQTNIYSGVCQLTSSTIHNQSMMGKTRIQSCTCSHPMRLIKWQRGINYYVCRPFCVPSHTYTYSPPRSPGATVYPVNSIRSIGHRFHYFRFPFGVECKHLFLALLHAVSSPIIQRTKIALVARANDSYRIGIYFFVLLLLFRFYWLCDCQIVSRQSLTMAQYSLVSQYMNDSIVIHTRTHTPGHVHMTRHTTCTHMVYFIGVICLRTHSYSMPNGMVDKIMLVSE